VESFALAAIEVFNYLSRWGPHGIPFWRWWGLLFADLV